MLLLVTPTPRRILVALAAALAVGALVAYLLIRSYCYRRFDGPLHAALEMLSASVKIDGDKIEWQPAANVYQIDGEHATDAVQWIIVDDRGRVVDGSRNIDTHAAESRALFKLARPAHVDRVANEPQLTQARAGDGRMWRLLQARLTAAPRPEDDDTSDAATAFVITTARTTVGLDNQLWQLLAATMVVPTVLWIVGAILLSRSGQPGEAG